jgi:hypothetical protein
MFPSTSSFQTFDMVPTCLLVQPPPKVEGGECCKPASKRPEEGVEDGVELSTGRDGVAGDDVAADVCQQRLMEFQNISSCLGSLTINGLNAGFEVLRSSKELTHQNLSW